MQNADADKFQIRIHTRADISTSDIIGQHTVYLHPHQNTVIGTVKLQKGKRDDNRVVLVKSYHGVQSTWETAAVHYFC